MRGIYFDGEKAVYSEDLPVPVPGKNHSRIRMLKANVCSTDKEVLKGYRPDFRGILGHEFVGIVKESAGRPELIGKMVVGELNEGCGKCIYCRTGREKHCPDRKVIGMDGLDGCFAEQMVLADHLLHEVPEGLSPEVAVYTEPLAAAIEITHQVHMDPALHMALIGDGRLAYMIAQVLSLQGCDLTVIGKHPEKLELFKPYGKVRLLEEYEDVGLLRGKAQEESTYEIVVEASGSPTGLDLAKNIIRRRGTIILKSTYAGNIQMDMSYFAVNEITITGSRCGLFDPALQLLSKGLVKLPDVEWHELRDYQAAFTSGAFKAGFNISNT